MCTLNLKLWDDFFPKVPNNTVFVYCRSCPFLCRYQWSLSKKTEKTCAETILLRKNWYKRNWRELPDKFWDACYFIAFFFSPREIGVDWAVLRISFWTCFIEGDQDLLKHRGFLFSIWACISMKSELYPISTLIRKPKLIKWASSRCDIKTFKDKNGIIMHHPAASQFH